jgi:hypothetical protein
MDYRRTFSDSSRVHIIYPLQGIVVCSFYEAETEPVFHEDIQVSTIASITLRHTHLTRMLMYLGSRPLSNLIQN